MKLKGGTILNGEFELEQKDIGIKNGKIHFDDIEDEELDVTGYIVIPGLIDLHIHGYMGIDLLNAKKTEMDQICNALAQDGTTSFLATLSTSLKADLLSALKNVSSYIKKGFYGSEILGINMEGPYLSKIQKGAMTEEYIRKADRDEFKGFYEAADSKIKMMTIAPEIKENKDFIRILIEHDIIPSIGHSNATSAETDEFIKEGIAHATHLFNGMRGIHHREAGVPGAVFDSNITAELICDGHHIDEKVIRMCYRLLGRERMILVSDAIPYAGMQDGDYIMQGEAVKIENGTCRLLNGTLNGNTNSLFECVKRAVGFGIPFNDAVYCASFGPARRLGLESSKGSIQQGKDADLIVLDEEFHLKYVLKNGNIV